MIRALLSLLLFVRLGVSFAQTTPAMDYGFPEEYEIGGITVSGTLSTDPNAVKLFTGLQVGDKITIPGDRISRAIRNLWEQRLFSDVRIEAAEVRGRTMFLNIIVEEKPRLSRFKFEGATRSESDKLREEIDLVVGQQVNEALLANTRYQVQRYYSEKGYLKAKAVIVERPDTLRGNSVLLIIEVDKGRKVKIKDVTFEGNEALKDKRLRRALKKTKRKRWWNFFGTSKFDSQEFKNDKNRLLDVYNNEGYRNASIVRDTTYFVSDDRMNVDLVIEEGPLFHFRNVNFTGNTKHTSEELRSILNVRKGDLYSKKVLDSRLYMNQSGRDVSSLYMDDGYLSFYVDPVELLVEGDSIDLDIRIREGKQYRIRNVIIKGNSKTHERVIRREIRTKPGQLFNRSDVIRTQRELSTLGYFNPESLGVNPIQDPRTGTVDLEYTVEEKPSDRLELSGGWGAGRLVMSLGLSFTNFSLRKTFDGKSWQPLPSGDGQTLNLRAQTNGRFFQSYSMSFVEPWLGGRKANALSFSVFHSVQTNGQGRFIDSDDGRIPNPDRQSLLISGATIGLGKRLTIPDDYFILRQTLGFQRYDLNNYSSGGVIFSFTNGTSNVLSYQVQLSRNSVDQPFFARSGSDISLTMKATPPFSLLGPERDWAGLEASERYKFAEFHKWKFTTQWYNKLTNSKSGHNFVLMTRAGFGYLGRYNADVGNSPFERFYLGGSALTGFQLDGREIVGLRGYDDFSLAPNTGNFAIAKYTAELRFPVSLNPSATIYTLGFVEAGNTWSDLKGFDPFKLYRSAGVGLRLFLPMFGPMGLDYGWRLDDVPDLPSMAKSQFHFTIGIDLGEL
ncbi:MAG: outer membrane protein assembly factor BamA [Flavobacteriales bacterium]|jgi:outer membrane protein insertion porin family|nr:outer membrane protein assembly factor BamA [Flavobacteriales bacterium]MBK9514445.1 outer membrane protein assembly factor BamA [Flavobacteriales bacterium]